MPPNPKLSIILPTRNRAGSLARFFEALETILLDYEVVVVDGASTDETPKVIARCAETNPCIRGLRSGQSGRLVADVNWALREARGEYLCEFGDDDVPLPGNFERKAAILDAHPEIGMVWSEWYYIDSNGGNLRLPGTVGDLSYSHINGRADFTDLLPGCIYAAASAVVFRRSLFEAHGGLDERLPNYYSHDYDLWLRYAEHTQTAFINEPLVKVRLDGSTTTGSVLGKGMYVDAKLHLWRKYLIDGERPHVVDERLWRLMFEHYLKDMETCFAGDGQTQQKYIQKFQQLQYDYAAAMSRRFAAETRTLPVMSKAGGEASRNGLPTVVWSGPAFEDSPYGTEVRGFAQALQSAGIRTRLEDVHWSPAIEVTGAQAEPRIARMGADYQALEDLRWTTLQPGEPYLQVWDVIPAYFRPDPAARAVVGRAAFGVDAMPGAWVEACHQVDQVWVPSDFQKEVLLRTLIPECKIRLLPPCIDVRRFSPEIEPGPLGTGRGFTFLAMPEWSAAHNWQALVRAWATTFGPDEDVSLKLVVKPIASKTPEQIGAEVQDVLRPVTHGAVASINLTYATVPLDELPRLYRGAQAFVDTSRCEAWSFPLMEAMASGVPAIGPAWAGNTAFLTEETGYPITCTPADVPAGAFALPYAAPGSRWADISEEHLGARLRQVFDDREAATRRARAARADMESRFSPAAVGQHLAQLCKEACQ